MIKFIQRFFDPSEKFDDESLIDLILELEDRVEYLEKENDSLSSFSELMSSRLDDLKSKGLPKNWDGVYTAETK